MKIKIALFFLAFSVGISMGGTAFGTPIDISGKGDYASFEGFLDYDPSTGKLTISIENTTNETYSDQTWSDNGAITGLGFYFPEFDTDHSLSFNPYIGFEGDPNYPKFDTLDKKGNPLGLAGYDFGASTGNNNILGGKVADGIKPGDSALFQFGFSGTIADFTSDSFVNAGEGGDFGFIRFQGIGPSSKYSDKITPSSGGGAQVPEPATIFLLGSGLLGLFGFRKKFWKPKK